MIDTPQIVRTSPQLIASIHFNVPPSQMQKVMGGGLAELKAVLAAQGVAPAGPWFTHHLRNPAETFDFEICIPVPAKILPAGRVQAGELPATTVARTIYRGPYDGLGPAWGEFQSWIKANGHKGAPDLWERYLAGPESSSDPSQWQTELNRPLVTE